jgi:hypothetical protein
MDDPWESTRNLGTRGKYSRIPHEIAADIMEAGPSGSIPSKWRLMQARKSRQLTKRGMSRLDALLAAKLTWTCLCLSEDKDDAPAWFEGPMWGHYAERGTGVCLVLRKDAVIAKAQTTFDDISKARNTGTGLFLYSPAPRLLCAPVSYRDPRLLEESRMKAVRELVEFELEHSRLMHNLNLDDLYSDPVPDWCFDAVEKRYQLLDEGVVDTLRALCCTKAAGWNYEREFRLVGYSRDFDGLCQTDYELGISIRGALQAIIVGPAALPGRALYWLERLMRQCGVRQILRYNGIARLSVAGELKEDGRLNMYNDARPYWESSVAGRGWTRAGSKDC